MFGLEIKKKKVILRTYWNIFQKYEETVKVFTIFYSTWKGQLVKSTPVKALFFLLCVRMF